MEKRGMLFLVFALIVTFISFYPAGFAAALCIDGSTSCSSNNLEVCVNGTLVSQQSCIYGCQDGKCVSAAASHEVSINRNYVPPNGSVIDNVINSVSNFASSVSASAKSSSASSLSSGKSSSGKIIFLIVLALVVLVIAFIFYLMVRKLRRSSNNNSS